jgi:hypothetical protein
MAIDYDAPVEASKSEDDWRAESDANTLARAEAIKEDKKRHDAAKAAAMKMLDDERKDVRLTGKSLRPQGSYSFSIDYGS